MKSVGFNETGFKVGKLRDWHEAVQRIRTFQRNGKMNACRKSNVHLVNSAMNADN